MSSHPQDPAGERFLTAVRAANATKAHLAARSGINLDRLNRILAPDKPARPILTEVVQLCNAAGVDPGELLRLLWPERVFDDPQAEIESLKAENRTLQLELQRIGVQLPTPTRSLLQLLAGSTRWSFSYMPFMSGPSPTTQLHSLNLFSVVSMAPELRDADYTALRTAFIQDVKSLPRGVDFTNWSTSGIPPQSYPVDPHGGHPYQKGPRGLMLASAVYNADRAISDHPITLRGAPSKGIIVLALRSLADRHRLATTLGRALGWSCKSTGRRGRLFMATNVDTNVDAYQSNQYANDALAETLMRAAPHTVISHVGTPVIGDGGEVLAPHALLTATDGEGPFVVLLSETDRLLEYSASQPVNQRGGRARFGAAQLAVWRDELRERTETLAKDGRGMVIDCDLPWPVDHPPLEGQEMQLRWRRTASHSRQALQQIISIGGVRRSMLTIRDDDAKKILSFGSDVAWH